MIIKVTYRKFDDHGPVEFEQVDHTNEPNLEDAMHELQRYAKRQLNRGGSWPVKIKEVNQ
jgi:hypothetical protein